MKVQTRLYEILEKAEEGDTVSKAVDVFLVSLILLNVCVVIVETVQWLQIPYAREFRYFEIFSISVFTLEYLLRLWVCTVDERFRHPLKGRLRYLVSPMALIDLVVILPFYLPLVVTTDLRVMRIIRLVRLPLLFKVVRYSRSIRAFTDVCHLKWKELSMVFLAIIFLLILSSAIVYQIENEAQPEEFSSIPAAMWWGVATLTTVGYGDVTPVTTLGKFFGALIAMLGIGFFALPAGIIGSGFVTIMQRESETSFECPHCHKEIRRDH